MATLAGVLALRACVSNLLDPRTGEDIRSPIIALYEIEQVDAKGGAGANGGGAAPLSALVLKDAAALPTESSAALDQNDPATLLLVQPPAHAALFSRPTAAEAAAAAATAAQRTLHFRVYHALPKEGKDGAAGGGSDGADDDMDLGFDADSDDEGSGQRFELLGSCALLASELAQAARSGVALELSLRNALSPLCSQTLKRAGTALTLHVRPASPSESGEERAFERLLELAHGDRFQGLPQRVAADETSHQALLALHLSALRLPVDEPVEGDEAVPRGDGAADQPRDDSVYLAAVFERDLRSGDMKLQGVTPWTRSNRAASAGASATALHFPGRICVDYFPGEMQLFQVSVYKFRAHQLARALAAVSAAPSPAGGAEAEAAAAQVPPVLFAMLREEERVGSCEFYLDYFGLESGFLVSQRAAAAQAHARGDYAAEPPQGPPALPPSVGRLTALPGRAHLLRLEMPLAHDVSSRAQADLARSGAAVVVGLDAGATTMSQNARVSVSVGVGAAAAAAGSVPDDLDLGVTAGVSAHSDEEISRMNQEQLDRAMRLLAGAGGGEPSKRADLVLPPNAVPDAADVDVSGAEDGASRSDAAHARTPRQC